MEKTSIQVTPETKTLLNKLKGLFMNRTGEKTSIDQVIAALAKKELELSEKK